MGFPAAPGQDAIIPEAREGRLSKVPCKQGFCWCQVKRARQESHRGSWASLRGRHPPPRQSTPGLSKSFHLGVSPGRTGTATCHPEMAPRLVTPEERRERHYPCGHLREVGTSRTVLGSRPFSCFCSLKKLAGYSWRVPGGSGW